MPMKSMRWRFGLRRRTVRVEFFGSVAAPQIQAAKCLIMEIRPVPGQRWLPMDRPAAHPAQRPWRFMPPGFPSRLRWLLSARESWRSERFGALRSKKQFSRGAPKPGDFAVHRQGGRHFNFHIPPAGSPFAGWLFCENLDHARFFGAFALGLVEYLFTEPEILRGGFDVFVGTNVFQGAFE